MGVVRTSPLPHAASAAGQPCAPAGTLVSVTAIYIIWVGRLTRGRVAGMLRKRCSGRTCMETAAGGACRWIGTADRRVAHLVCRHFTCFTAHSKGRSLFDKWAGKGRQKFKKNFLMKLLGKKRLLAKRLEKRLLENTLKLMLCFGIAPLLCALPSFGKWGERATINDNNLLGKPHSDGGDGRIGSPRPMGTCV